MPTKHKRKRGKDDKSQYDLPPTSHARSLPVIQPTKDFLTARTPTNPSNKRRKTTSHEKGAIVDDTPKNFARLMAWHMQGKKLAPGLDDGTTAPKKAKKRKEQNGTQTQQKTPQASATSKGNNVRVVPKSKSTSTPSTVVAKEEQSAPDSSTAAETQVLSPGTESTSKSAKKPQQQKQQEEPPLQAAQPLKIRPGETLSEFNLRVDQALPLSGATNTKANINSNIPADLRVKARLTKHNKRLERMQAEWRATEARLRAKEEEEEDEDAERRDEDRVLWEDVKASGGKLKKGKRKAVVDEDPWKELEKKRAETKQKNVRDVVLEPPVLKSVKNIFKDKPVGNRTGMGQNGLVRV